MKYFLLLCLCLPFAYGQQVINISNDAGLRHEQFTKNLQESLSPYHKARTFHLNQYIKSQELKSGDFINFNFFEERSFVGKITQKYSDINNVTSIACKLENYIGNAYITFDENNYIITLENHSKDQYYIVEETQNQHYLLHLDMENQDYLSCGGETTLSDISHGHNLIERSTREIPNNNDFSENNTRSTGDCNQNLSAEDPATVTILTAYTQNALNDAGSVSNMNNAIAQAVLKCNTASQNSGVGISYVLVHSYLTDYTESGSSSNDLTRLRAQDDGYMDEVHNLRNTHLADFVHLISFVTDTGGIGFRLQNKNGRDDLAFGITRVQQLSWTYTMAHEIGHNMGLSHSKFQTSNTGTSSWYDWPENTWSAGWRFQAANTGNYHTTVMAYEGGNYWSNGVYSPRVPYFSTPTISYEGTAIGDPVDGDAARTLKTLKHIYSVYRYQSSGHCAASGSNPSTADHYISRVQIDNIDNSSAFWGGDGGGYKDYSPLMQTTVLPGQPKTLTVETPSSSPGTLFVWIDWDNNIVFDSDEFLGSFSATGNQFSVDIEPPADVTSGRKIMRLRLSPYSYENQPCGEYTFGEVEDYAIFVPYSRNPNTAGVANLQGGVFISTHSESLVNAPNAQLALESKSQGMVIPSLTEAQISSIPSENLVEGMTVFSTDANGGEGCLKLYSGEFWNCVSFSNCN